MLKILTSVLFINMISVHVQPFLLVPNAKSSILKSLALPKVHWIHEKSFAISFQYRNDAQYFFSTFNVSMCLVYLILLSVYNLDSMLKCSNPPAVRSNIASKTVDPSWSDLLIQVNLFLKMLD